MKLFTLISTFVLTILMNNAMAQQEIVAILELHEALKAFTEEDKQYRTTVFTRGLLKISMKI